MEIYRKISKCRVCGCTELAEIINLGDHALTGVFPRPDEEIKTSPIVLVKCQNEECGHVQLQHSTNPDLMFGDTYGYTSALNKSMITHLGDVANECHRWVKLSGGDIVLDIGSNDATLLRFFAFHPHAIKLVGMDPSGAKFSENYTEMGAELHPTYFSKKLFEEKYPGQKAKLVTTIACFYDMEDPVAFAKEVHGILADDGIWAIEVAYLKDIVEKLCYDGTCAEHLSYFSLKSLMYVLKKAGFNLVNVLQNDTNGGSIQVLVTKGEAKYIGELAAHIMLKEEAYLTSRDLKPYEDFRARIEAHASALRRLFSELHWAKVYGMGASTKWNVVLQYCGISKEMLPKIGDVNPYKFGRVTPGTKIPIMSEEDALADKPNYFIVGPYHFRESLLKKEKIQLYLKEGGAIIFPLPNIEIVRENSIESYHKL